MNIHDRLVKITQDNDDWADPYQAAVDTAVQILEEFWPVPKEYFDCKTLTDGTLVFELKRDDDDYCCEYCE